MSDAALNDPGPKPDLQWIDKTSFCVDHHYQRSIDSKRSQEIIAKITERFLWARFQPPTVTPDSSGRKYIVIDGQHRIAAAMNRADIKNIPCYIVPGLTLEQQAENFVAINRDRAGLHPLHIHRALLAMGDPAARAIQDVCDEAEITIARQPAGGGMTKPRETAAVGTIGKGIKVYGAPNVIAALMVLGDAFKLAPGMMRAAVMKALMEFFQTRGVAKVDRERLIRLIKETPPPEMEDEARKQARRQGGTTHEHIIRLIDDAYGAAPAPQRAEIPAAPRRESPRSPPVRAAAPAKPVMPPARKETAVAVGGGMAKAEKIDADLTPLQMNVCDAVAELHDITGMAARQKNIAARADCDPGNISYALSALERDGYVRSVLMRDERNKEVRNWIPLRRSGGEPYKPDLDLRQREQAKALAKASGIKVKKCPSGPAHGYVDLDRIL